jgi:hypothetical protein
MVIPLGPPSKGEVLISLRKRKIIEGNSKYLNVYEIGFY